MTARARVLAARNRRRVAGIASIVLVFAAAASGAAVASTAASRSHVQPPLTAPAQDIRYAVNKPLCGGAATPGHVSCFAVQRVTVSKGTPGAYPYLKSSTLTAGPAGGYTPADLAQLYGYNPAVARASQTVGIVDWFDDAHIASDLKVFDHNYGLAAETKKSFRVVNQNGAKSPLPSSKKGKSSSGEIALDVESVRSVCHTCRILLVEAKAPSNQDVSIAENTAVRMGATEVSNSFGGPEPVPGGEAASTVKAFNHPGVVITASTGDDGWFDWDFLNAQQASAGAALFPSTDPDVVAVGGVGFTPNTAASAQYVWNNNGPDDQQGLTDGRPDGAGGGGCSQLYSAKSWQSAYPGYSAAGCAGKRLAADVASLADPATGFDEYNTWVASHPGWVTVGGTSLASPIIAAMYALAGGSGGAAYPSQSLYKNAALHPTLFTDITVGGNGFCGGDTTLNCGNDVESLAGTHNPNAVGAGNVDCSFPRNNSDPTSAPSLSSECNAVAGFDGPSGVGAPIGVGLFASTSPKISLTVPKLFRLNKSYNFTATATPRLAGAHITSYEFNWGDGHTTTGTVAAAKHTYTKPGSHTITLTVADSAGQHSVAYATIAVGKKLSIKVFGSGGYKAHKKAHFDAVIKDPNTGGKVTKVRWNWGDHKASKGLKVSHAWAKAGKYIITVTATDNTGVTTTFTARLTVKS